MTTEPRKIEEARTPAPEEEIKPAPNADEKKSAPTEEKKPAPKMSPGKALALRIVLGVIIVAGLIWGICAFVHSLYYESTDDAFVEGHVVTVGTKLSNIVQNVLIDDNYDVKKGDLLVQIDPRDYQVQVDAAQANYDKAQADYVRDLALANSQAISKQDLDTTRATFDVTKAQLDQAKLNLEYTRITAPVDGRITRKAVEAGDYIQTGQTLFSIVPHDIWITANFKETQLTYMQPGQPATIRIDAFPGKVFKGHVDSLQSGTGSRFSLLPPENATGNYVKVVQRLPVKIRFDEPPAVQAAFAPGLSVVPEVNISVTPQVYNPKAQPK
jgi:membrane fusion protein (multidrug efflux system)